MKQLKLGSLFDGSGGFPLAGVLHGIEPVWASEIEPFPIRVTKLRFPNMKHLGSVTDVNGAEVEPVDIITFGSPCQDLSVAGKQAGIHDGERSNLFFEAIRIIKEMREHDRATGRSDIDVRPRFAVWENVPGAFSSNKGRDFQAVLQALCDIRGGQGHIVPLPPKGKWLPAGCIVGDGWSVAWRVYDAQYWGVPQRRKRIYLIADFGSERAGEILFERESVRGDSAESGEAREGTAPDVEGSAGRSDSVKCMNPWDAQSIRQFDVNGCWPSLQAYSNGGQNRCGVCYALDSMSSNSMKSSNPHSGFHEETITKTLDTNPDPTCNQGGNVIVQPASFMGGQGAKARPIAYCDDGSTPTLKSAPSGTNTVPDVVYPINTMVATRGGKDDMRTCFGIGEPNAPQFTLSAAHEHGVCYAIEGNVADRDAKQNGSGISEGSCPTLNSVDRHAVCFQQNQRDEVRNMGQQTGALMAEPGTHNQNYVCFRKSTKPGTDGSGERWVEDEKTNTLNTFEFHSEVRTPEIVCYEGQNVCCDSQKAFTLQSGRPDQQHIPSVVYRQDDFAGYSEDVVTLKASGGDMGGGTESIVVERV